MRKQYEFNQPFDDLVLGSTCPVSADIEKREIDTGVFEYTAALAWDAKKAYAENGEVCFTFLLPCVDLQYMWHPDSRTKRVLDADWRLGITSMLTCSAPMAMLFNGAGINTFTFAADEVRKALSVEFGVKDAGGSSHIAGKIGMGFKQFGTKDSTVLRIRADFRRIPCCEAADAVRAWWEDILDLTPMPVPESARLPLYSSWYNFHKEIDADTLVNECRLAKQLGMETIIVDDGWQTSNNGTGYGYTGDWVACPAKFGNVKNFVEQVHAIGMKVMFWFSVPFMGYFSENWKRFEHMILRREDRNSTGILDPRYPEVRAFLKELYVSAITEYGLDGLKLDFIDRFQRPDHEEKQPGMDFECVQEATDYMMNDIMAALRNIKPDIMVEFRQHYIGPCMRTFGNMFRVADCPSDITSNRVGIGDLRMLSGDTAVHSDMITWNDADAPQDAALQVLNTIFGVTQVSKVLSEMTPEHTDMLRFWLDFEIRHRNVLQKGRLRLSEPNYLYPVISAVGGGEQIIGIFANDKVADVEPDKKKNYIINACWQDRVTLRVSKPETVRLTVNDCMGHTVRCEQITLNAGINEFDVPRSGLLTLEELR